ncbi:MAG: hypothetical protein CSB46_01305, partial [Micrococcales bacterium]
MVTEEPSQANGSTADGGTPGIFPVSWPTGMSDLEPAWRSAHKYQWDPALLTWSAFRPASYSWEQREALGYWWTLMSTYVSAAPPVYAAGLMRAYESREPDVLRRCVYSLVRDGVIHDLACRGVVSGLLETYEPAARIAKTSLGQRLSDNVGSISAIAGEAWARSRESLMDVPLPVLMASFIVGKTAAATVSHQLGAGSVDPLFQEVFRKIGRDNERHVQIVLAVLNRDFPYLPDAHRELVTRQLRVSSLYVSALLLEPQQPMWNVPDEFIVNQKAAEDACRTAGFNIPDV